MTSKVDYTSEDVVASLRSVGVERGDIVFCHVSTGRLGRPSCELTTPAVATLLFDALREAVGPEGTVLFPTYSYSIGKNEVFDPDSTPGTIGPIPELFRKLPGAIRSADPMLAVSGVGPHAEELLGNLPWTCYGEGSVYARLREYGAKICTIGLPLHWATFRHHIEEMARVPFRFAKLFTGDVLRDGVARRQTWTYFAAVRQACCAPDGIPLQEILRERGDCRVASLGRSEVWMIEAQKYFDRGMEEMGRDPWLTAKGPGCSVSDLVEMERDRVAGERPRPVLTAESGVMDIMRELTPLARDVVSDGFDAALEAISHVVPLQVHEYPSGESCFEWIVPEKWTCHAAWLERLDGTRLIDAAGAPLHVMSYSQPFEGEISREDLLPHLYTHPTLPDAVPFVYSYFVRRWGLCCSRSLKESLNEDRYRVCIRSETSFGTLKVGEVVVEGELDSGFVLCAHLDHPGQANDGLSGVAVGIEVMKRLKLLKPRHTVRLLIVSETFGSLAWLSHLPANHARMKAGLFLEMLGLDHPLAVQRSWAANTRWDEIGVEVARRRENEAWDAPFLQVVTNDDRQFNAPGIRIPMLSLSRVSAGARSGKPVFPEYHSNFDDAARVHAGRMEASVEAVLEILEGWDAETTPVPRYSGEPCLTRVGLQIDFTTDLDAGARLYDVMHAVDGHVTDGEIANRTNVPLDQVRQILDRMSAVGLVSFE